MDPQPAFDLVVPAPAQLEELPPLVADSETVLADLDPVLPPSEVAPAQAPLIPLRRSTPAFDSRIAPSVASRTGGVLWPSTIPGLDVGERVLAAVIANQVPELPSLISQTRTVIAKLSPLEKAALSNEISSEDAALVFRRAASTRWRLVLALDSTPAAADSIDRAALDELTHEIDQVLHQITALVDLTTSPTAQQAIVDVRSALANLGEDLGARINKRVEAPKHSGPLVTSAKPPPTRMKSVTTVAFPGQQKRASPWWAAVGILVVAGSVTWWALDDDVPTLMQQLEGAPQGMVGMENKETGTILLQTRNHLPPPPEFKDYAERMTTAGWTVTERVPTGEGSYLLVQNR